MLYKFSTIQHDYHAQQNCPGSSLSPAQKSADGGPQPPFSTSTHAPSLSGILPSPPSSPPTSPPSLSSPPSLYPHLLSPSTLPPPPLPSLNTTPPPHPHPLRPRFRCRGGLWELEGRGRVSGRFGSARLHSGPLGSTRVRSAPFVSTGGKA